MVFGGDRRKLGVNKVRNIMFGVDVRYLPNYHQRLRCENQCSCVEQTYLQDRATFTFLLSNCLVILPLLLPYRLHKKISRNFPVRRSCILCLYPLILTDLVVAKY